MTRKKKAASGPRGRSKMFRNAINLSSQSADLQEQRSVEDFPHFSLLEEARSTERHRSTWTTETKLRHAKVNFVTAGMHHSTDEHNSSQADKHSDRGVQEEMGRLGRPTANTTAFFPQSLPQQIMGEGDQVPATQVENQSLYIVDTQGQKPANGRRPAPIIQSPSSIDSGSSDEEVVFTGRRPQTTRRVIEDPVFVDVPKPAVFPIQATNTSQSSRSSKPSNNAIVTSNFLKDSSNPMATNLKPSWDNTSVEWEHRSKPGIGWSVPRMKLKVTSDPVRRGYKLKDQEKDNDEDEDEDEQILQDYIENMKSEEASTHTAGFLQYRELDVQMDHSSVNIKFQPNVVEVTNSEEDNTSEDDSKRVNVSKGKGRMLVVSDSELSSSGEDDEDDGKDSDSFPDHAELEQRHQDGIDDEVLARLLAKQEELGIDSEELALLDNDAINIVNIQKEAALYAPKKSKKSRRSNGSFSSPGFMAGVLEQDPYDNFDIMDFNRPSLRLKSKNKKTKLPFDLSDSDLQETMESSWQTDRDRKRARKAEREILRMQGLLGKRNKGKANLSNVYQEGLNVGDMEEVFRDFLQSTQKEQSLPPMDKLRRKMVHELASAFNMTSKSKGTKTNRFPILIKTSHTKPWSSEFFCSRTKQMNAGFFPRLDAQTRGKTSGSRAPRRTAGGGGNAPGTNYRDGDVVGAAAPELGAENRGRAMLEKMGWAAGTGLGAVENKGILQPIAHVVKNSRAGLG